MAREVVGKKLNFNYGGYNYNPGRFRLDRHKLKKLRPDIFSFKQFMCSEKDSPSFIQPHMEQGDIQPAVVVSTDPLLVACYTNSMDAVVLMCLPTMYGVYRGYEIGTRLICVNVYDFLNKGRKNNDIIEGPRSVHQHSLFGPIIADLFTDDVKRLEDVKALIPNEMWEYVEALGNQYMAVRPGMARNGLGNRFYDSVPIESIQFNPKLKLD